MNPPAVTEAILAEAVGPSVPLASLAEEELRSADAVATLAWVVRQAAAPEPADQRDPAAEVGRRA